MYGCMCVNQLKITPAHVQEAAAGRARELARARRLRRVLQRAATKVRRARAKRVAHRNEVLLGQARVRAFVRKLERM